MEFQDCFHGGSRIISRHASPGDKSVKLLKALLLSFQPLFKKRLGLFKGRFAGLLKTLPLLARRSKAAPVARQNFKLFQLLPLAARFPELVGNGVRVLKIGRASCRERV